MQSCESENLAAKAEFSDFFYFLEARAAPLSEVEKISDKDGIETRGRISRALRGHCTAPQEQPATLQVLQNASFLRSLKSNRTFHKN